MTIGALSINDNIKIANEAFGLNMPSYSEPWAMIPLALLKLKIADFTSSAQEPTNVVDNVTPNVPPKGDEEQTHYQEIVT